MSGAVGVGDAQPPRRAEPHEARWEAVETRERLARERPEILIRPRRDSGGLFFDVSAPGFAALGYDDPVVMMRDLQGRYPA